MPGAVEGVIRAHCRNGQRMTLDEFWILLSFLNDVSGDAAVDYLFTIVDMTRPSRLSTVNHDYTDCEYDRCGEKWRFLRPF